MIARLFRIVERLARYLVRTTTRQESEVLALDSGAYADAPPVGASPSRLSPGVLAVIGLLVVTNLLLLAGVVYFVSRPPVAQSPLAPTQSPLIEGAAAAPEPTIIVVTPTPQATATPAAIGDIVGDVAAEGAPTSGPSPTPPANPFDIDGTIAISLRRSGYANLYAFTPGQTELTRLTAGTWEDRDPAWSPDGRRLAFSSNRAQGYDIYVLDILTGEFSRITSDPGFESNPSWSPDGLWLTYEGYTDNFDVYIVPAEANADPIRVTNSPAADFAPTWSPEGRQIAFVSHRDGNAELYLYNLDVPEEAAGIVRLTNTASITEDEPRWRPDSQAVLFSDAASPLDLVYMQPLTPNTSAREIAQGDYPIFTPDNTGIATVFNQNNRQFIAAAAIDAWSAAPVAVAIEGQMQAISWTLASLPEELSGSIAAAADVDERTLWEETIREIPEDPEVAYALVEIPDLNAPFPLLSDRVDEAFDALRLRVIIDAGWDFLGELDNAAIPISAPLAPGEDLENWNRAGRAIDLAQEAYNQGWIYVQRQELGGRQNWRIWLRTRQADGTLGEPLRYLPWDFTTRFSGNPEFYDDGGSYFDRLPGGYFIDFTALAESYGWKRVPADENWRAFYPGIKYWHFEFRGGLDWPAAMAELFPSGAYATATPFSTPTFTPTVTLTPSQTLIPTETGEPPTLTPSITPTPTVTYTPTVTNTATVVVTRLGPSPTPTATGTPTRTATPSRTPTATRTASATP